MSSPRRHIRKFSLVASWSALAIFAMMQSNCSPVGASVLKGFKRGFYSSQSFEAGPESTPSSQSSLVPVEENTIYKQWQWSVQDPRWESFGGAKLGREALEQFLRFGQIQIEWTEQRGSLDEGDAVQTPDQLRRMNSRASAQVHFILGVHSKDPETDPSIPKLALELISISPSATQIRQRWLIRIQNYGERTNWNLERLGLLSDYPITLLKLL